MFQEGFAGSPKWFHWHGRGARNGPRRPDEQQRWRRSDARPTAHSNTMLRRVQNFVETRLDDESLTPAEVARVNRVSIRYVNKLFEREGYTLPRWIRMRRLERCRLELEDTVTPARRIADIAYAHGFKNVSHFNRVFRARFGCSPRGFRQRK